MKNFVQHKMINMPLHMIKFRAELGHGLWPLESVSLAVDLPSIGG